MTAAPSPATNQEPKLPPRHAKSPDKNFSVDMEGDENAAQHVLVIRDGKNEIARKDTTGFLFGVFWEKTGKYVAINNRTATSGDYIWVFSLPDGKCIKEADSEQLSFLSDYASKAIHRLQPDIKDDNIAHFRISTNGWSGTDNKLLVQVAHDYQYSRGGEHVSEWYVYDAAVKMTGTQFEWVAGGEARKVDHYSY